MKKLLLSTILSIMSISAIAAPQEAPDDFAADASYSHDKPVPMNIDLSYKINIKRVEGSTETNYEGHVVYGRVAYFNQMVRVSYVADSKCKNDNDCDIVKGTENEGISYIVDIDKPKNQNDLIVFLQINEKQLLNKRKVCDAGPKSCVDYFDVNLLNFKEAVKVKNAEPKSLRYNNVSYTITLTKE